MPYLRASLPPCRNLVLQEMTIAQIRLAKDQGGQGNEHTEVTFIPEKSFHDDWSNKAMYLGLYPNGFDTD